MDKAQESWAEFSPCRTWRYALGRSWDWQGHGNQVMFIGLNPSTADEFVDDPTIRRCIGFAKRWGYGGLIMTNAYAYRATNPKVMKAAIDPVGPENDEVLSYRASHVGLIVAAWGAHCDPEREKRVCQIMRGRPIHRLGKTKAGRPKHPLYLRADTQLELFFSPDFDSRCRFDSGGNMMAEQRPADVLLELANDD